MSNMSTLGILSSGKCQSPANVSDFIWEAACFEELKSISGRKNKTWGLVLVSVLTFAVLIGTIVSVRHSVKLKRQARNQRQEIERAEIRERLRLLQRRYDVLIYQDVFQTKCLRKILDRLRVLYITFSGSYLKFFIFIPMIFECLFLSLKYSKNINNSYFTHQIGT